MRDQGVRTWGNSPDGATVLLTGTYNLEGEVSRRLLRALPQLLVLRDDEWDCPVIGLLADEIVKDEPGQEAVLDRLLDLLLIAVLRAWFARPEAAAPGWYRAHADPVVGRGAAPAARRSRAAVDGGGARPRVGRLAGGLRAALRGPRRRAADGLPHRLAHRAGRRPAARARRDGRLRRPPGRLRQPVRAQHGVQARCAASARSSTACGSGQRLGRRARGRRRRARSASACRPPPRAGARRAACAAPPAAPARATRSSAGAAPDAAQERPPESSKSAKRVSMSSAVVSTPRQAARPRTRCVQGSRARRAGSGVPSSSCALPGRAPAAASQKARIGCMPVRVVPHVGGDGAARPASRAGTPRARRRRRARSSGRGRTPSRRRRRRRAAAPWRRRRRTRARVVDRGGRAGHEVRRRVDADDRRRASACARIVAVSAPVPQPRSSQVEARRQRQPVEEVDGDAAAPAADVGLVVVRRRTSDRGAPSAEHAPRVRGRQARRLPAAGRVAASMRAGAIGRGVP